MTSLEFSRIGLHLGHFQDRVALLGEIRKYSSGEFLCRKNTIQHTLHIILEGNVIFEGGGFGPGSHTGEIGFVLGTPRTADVIAFDDVTTWSVEFENLNGDLVAATVLLSAIALELPSRVRTLSSPSDIASDYCNFDHPAIQRLAHKLRDYDEVASARRIWSFVQAIPYRFGIWWQSASDTLQQGSGMCTTKSNLQVAICRAAGIEAGFVEINVEADCLRKFLPPKWGSIIKEPATHFLAAVKLGGRWHPAESSYTDPLLNIISTYYPNICGLNNSVLDIGSPIHPAALLMGRDPYDIIVIPSLNHAMAKRSSHNVDRLEVMNVVLDRIQGFTNNIPDQVKRSLALIETSPELAFHFSLGYASALAEELRSLILEPA